MTMDDAERRALLADQLLRASQLLHETRFLMRILGLEKAGGDLKLKHELRMFAMAFNDRAEQEGVHPTFWTGSGDAKELSEACYEAAQALRSGPSAVGELPQNMRWLPIESAHAVPASEHDGAERFLLCHEPTGRMMVGPILDFTGDDGVVRRGCGSGMGIFMATHYCRLPDAPQPREAQP